jgi:nitrogen-specific signal transduction histidine kinase
MTERREIEEKLRQSQKMDALGQLTGGVAHDFNNLLTVIMGSLEILTRWLSAPRNSSPPSRVTRAIAGAKDASRRAATLTQRLLAFSRQQPLHPATIDPNRLVHNLVEMLRRTLGERVRVKTVLGFDTGFIEADPAELENALLNLVVNSRDAMPEGGTITIETARVDDDKLAATGSRNRRETQYVLITVADNGAGMDRQTLAKAFDPFFTTKEADRGTGLGLSQVYGFVQQSGGQVQIESEPGVGTSVQIYLPRLPDDAEESGALDESAAADEQKGTETVLVVEDDDAIRGYCTDVLREFGYHVLEAPNAGAALEILDRQPDVRLLLTDIGLPGPMNGRQLSDEARQRRSELKVVLTTGYTGDTVIHTGRLERGVSLMVKPFSFADLTRKVREALDA